MLAKKIVTKDWTKFNDYDLIVIVSSESYRADQSAKVWRWRKFAKPSQGGWLETVTMQLLNHL